jgi:hypothetical protein
VFWIFICLTYLGSCTVYWDHSIKYCLVSSFIHSHSVQGIDYLVDSGNDKATREEIESAAREANCEFVWGMPKGFDTESE